MINKTKRIEWIDMAKGYGIILVILAHCGAGFIEAYIYSFHMPLFFFLSGYVFNAKNGFIPFLKKKCKSIILPYFCLGIPMLLFYALWNYATSGYTIKQFIESACSFIIQKRMWTLWFLACLFFLNLLFYFTLKLLKTNKKLLIFSILSVFLGYIYYKYIDITLPWNIDVCLMAYPFFFVGYFYKCKCEIIDKYLNNKKTSIILCAIFGIINILTCYCNIKITGEVLDMHGSSYGIIPLTFISALSGIICVIIISKLITIKPIRYIGENSLLYFAWHQTIMIPISTKVLSLINMSINLNSSFGNKVVYRTSQLIIILIMITICNVIITKTKLKFMLGK